jgi:HEPN domain-containing protein
MREEVENWWKQAERDLSSAKNAFKSKDYYLVAFLCQQTVEKALKALYIKKRRESPGQTHSLIFLGKSTDIPGKFYGALRRLSPDFVITRYPDAAHGLPYELYDEEIAKERMGLAKTVIEWVKEELKK